MNKGVLLSLFLILTGAGLFGQGSNLPLGNPAYPILDRLSIKTGAPAPFTPTVKYFTRGAVARYAMALDTSGLPLSDLDRHDLHSLFLDNNEWLGQAPWATAIGGRRVPVFPDTAMTQIEASLADPRYERSRKPLFGFIYPTPANFLEVNQRFVHLRINPILNFQLGQAAADEQLLFFNQRGVELRGGIDDRIYFYTQVLETQARFPNYVNDFIRKYRAVPGAGLYKSFKSAFFDIDQGYDFLNGQGYVGFNFSRHVGLQFGYGRNVIGNGYRSLFLSDFSNNYLYLKLNWQVWKLHLQNIFGELAVRSANATPGLEIVDKKYLAGHYLSFDVLPNLSIGLFEAVIFDRPNQFELHYLNPVILYRTVEQALGSPDNVLLGFDGRWNLWRRFQLYGQLIFDEFVFNELFRDERGWWANKFGIQGGLKYINAFGIDHLDLQAEYNLARPYTYTHYDEVASYSHYNQPLAHPLGANFREWILLARYQPIPRLIVEGRLLHARTGDDRDTTNWGSNILLPNTTREQDFGNRIGQGIGADILLFGLDASYRLAPNVFLVAHYFHRDKDSEDNKLDLRTRYITGGIRINIGRERMDF